MISTLGKFVKSVRSQTLGYAELRDRESFVCAVANRQIALFTCLVPFSGVLVTLCYSSHTHHTLLFVCVHLLASVRVCFTCLSAFIKSVFATMCQTVG